MVAARLGQMVSLRPCRLAEQLVLAPVLTAESLELDQRPVEQILTAVWNHFAHLPPNSVRRWLSACQSASQCWHQLPSACNQRQAFAIIGQALVPDT